MVAGILMIFVAGGGVYGSKALISLKSSGRILVADIDKGCRASRYVDCIVYDLDELIKIESKCSTALLVSDAAETLVRLFKAGIVPSLIIPATPMHLAGKVLELYLVSRMSKADPSPSVVRIADAVRSYGIEVKVNSLNGVAVMSYMPFGKLCKPRCIEPSLCPVTGRVKPIPLNRLLDNVLGSIISLSTVLESQLIVEEVGGYSGRNLFSFLEEVDRGIPHHSLVAIATACSCHGIVNVFDVESSH